MGYLVLGPFNFTCIHAASCKGSAKTPWVEHGAARSIADMRMGDLDRSNFHILPLSHLGRESGSVLCKLSVVR